MPTYDDFYRDPYYAAYYPRGPVHMGRPMAGPVPGMATPPAGWHDGFDDEGDPFPDLPGPDVYIRQALDRLETTMAAQRQAMKAAQLQVVQDLVAQLAAEGYMVDPNVDVPDLAAQPTAAARKAKVEFIRRTRAKKPVTASRPKSPNVAPRLVPYRLGMGTSGVLADPGLGVKEKSYSELAAEAEAQSQARRRPQRPRVMGR